MSNYPISEDGPACPMLQDPELWKNLFDEKARWDLYHVIRKSLQKDRSDRSLAPQPDDGFLESDDFFHLLADRLSSFNFRNELEKKAKRSDLMPLPNTLYEYGMNQWENLDDLSVFCRHQGDKHFATGETFAKFLDNLDEKLNEEELHYTSLCALAFCMIQPKDAPEIITPIVERYPDSASWFGM